MHLKYTKLLCILRRFINSQFFKREEIVWIPALRMMFVPGSSTFNDASSLCQSSGAILASVQNLHYAWRHSYEKCSCGWLSDASARMPVIWGRENCGDANQPSQIYNCNINVDSRYGAFCITRDWWVHAKSVWELWIWFNLGWCSSARDLILYIFI